jgi:translin
MSYSKVESSLSDSSAFFNQVVQRREQLIKDSREVISLASKTIVALHTSNFKEARKFHKKAKQKLAELRKVAKYDLTKYLTVPEQEFVESSAIFALMARQTIPSLQQMEVSPFSYILGLLDAIGELKRLVYDSIRKGNLKEAEDQFNTMETLFAFLSPFAVYDNIVQGVRRKLDVARFLIEDTRATVTEEVRRQEFMHTVQRFSEQIGASSITIPDEQKLKKRSSRQVEESHEEDSTEESISDASTV